MVAVEKCYQSVGKAASFISWARKSRDFDNLIVSCILYIRYFLKAHILDEDQPHWPVSVTSESKTQPPEIPPMFARKPVNQQSQTTSLLSIIAEKYERIVMIHTQRTRHGTTERRFFQVSFHCVHTNRRRASTPSWCQWFVWCFQWQNSEAQLNSKCIGYFMRPLSTTLLDAMQSTKS